MSNEVQIDAYVTINSVNLPTFITGNKHKAEYLSRHLGFSLPHIGLSVDEIQSLDLAEVVAHKAKQAYAILKKPTLVQDVSLEFHFLGKLPGTFIRFFVDTVPFQNICDMVPKNNRGATARVIYGLYDGSELTFFEGELKGSISLQPRGTAGFGWDSIFIPSGYTITRAEMSPEEDEKTYCLLHPFDKLRLYLSEATSSKTLSSPA